MATSSNFLHPDNLSCKSFHETQNVALQKLTKNHIDSFDYLVFGGLKKAVQTLPPVEFELPNGERCFIYIKEAVLLPPCVDISKGYIGKKIYPSECRQRGIAYNGDLHLTFSWKVDGMDIGTETKVIGSVPVMVKSKICNLYGLNPQELIKCGEETEEMGGYFVVSGYEKIIRMLIMPRRNYPNAMTRSSWKSRGKLFTDSGISMRCVAEDQTSSTMVLHYLTDGSAILCCVFSKNLYYIPIILILKGLLDVSDYYIFKELTKGKEDNSFYKGCIANMLRKAQREGLSNRKKILEYIGEMFRVKLYLPTWFSNQDCGEYLLQKCICIHLTNKKDKFNTLIYMTRKLYAFAKKECAAESSDNPMFQEALLPGHLYLQFLKERIFKWMLALRTTVLKVAAKKEMDYHLNQVAMTNALRHVSPITQAVKYFMSTGTLISDTGLGLMQNTGLVVMADKLNFYRYVSHFRSIHRGAFFTTMRTTSCRKLLPESWGFICPVHTPDGTPCGLLNHLSALCEVVNFASSSNNIAKILVELGMESYDHNYSSINDSYAVMLDGKILGWVCDSIAKDFTRQIRMLKVDSTNDVSSSMEICFVEKTEFASQYPGIYLFTGLSRLVRPVRNLAANKIEFIGTFEQVYLDIAVVPEEAHPDVTTHMELSKDSILSVISLMTPYSDYNQSPRNMYQCQMGKQTIGLPIHSFPQNAHTKLYRLQTPQTPVTRSEAYDKYAVDNYPLGTNAVVAVISYTGYDMEDAMILNKASHERGFAHATIYKTQIIDLHDVTNQKGKLPVVFGRKNDEKLAKFLDTDGLPYVGVYLQDGDPLYSYINIQNQFSEVKKYKNQEDCYVDMVKILGGDSEEDYLTRVSITFRITRNPIIGDKFASRHGQKGICSQKWPFENMPFFENGMMPDIIFNPHGFPSRMTIGMMIESMAGKSAAMHGLYHDCTPFKFTENDHPIEFFGNMLKSAGYNYFGTERMYSGITGREFEADIFVGVVYYQRLRHMVSDKFQVRTTGPVDLLTQQPVKGRKRQGGIRFGEMERDGLLSHGTAFLLEDRLLNCSDRCIAKVCTKCGSLISPLIEKSSNLLKFDRKWKCRVCDKYESIVSIAIPYVLRYLVVELAAMNIKVEFNVGKTTGALNGS